MTEVETQENDLSDEVIGSFVAALGLGTAQRVEIIVVEAPSNQFIVKRPDGHWRVTIEREW